MCHNSKLPVNIRENIEYMQHEYFISYLSLIEIDNLQKLNKVRIKHEFKPLIRQIKDANIKICFSSLWELETLFELDIITSNEKAHGDYIDRMIIATAIAKHYTLISADTKFPRYRKFGMELIEI